MSAAPHPPRRSDPPLSTGPAGPPDPTGPTPATGATVPQPPAGPEGRHPTPQLPTEPAAPGASPPSLSWPVTIALHLAPGAALLGVAATTGPLLDAAGLPPVWGLLGGILLVLAPLELGLLRALRRRDRAAGRPVGPLLGRGRLGRGRAVPVGAAVLVAALVLPGLVLPVESPLRDRFGWLPAGPGPLAGQPPAVVAGTVALWLVAAVLVGPLVEEAWFRGFLQPRIPATPLPAALIGSTLFAVYHLWQPHAALTVLAFALPIAVLVARTGASAVGAVVHVVVNLVTFAGLLADVIAR
jgi:membrane protease YdiL (CAAX protease family)